MTKTYSIIDKENRECVVDVVVDNNQIIFWKTLPNDENFLGLKRIKLRVKDNSPFAYKICKNKNGEITSIESKHENFFMNTPDYLIENFLRKIL